MYHSQSVHLVLYCSGCSTSCCPHRHFLSWRMPSTLSPVNITHWLTHVLLFSLNKKMYISMSMLVRVCYHAVDLTKWVFHRKWQSPKEAPAVVPLLALEARGLVIQLSSKYLDTKVQKRFNTCYVAWQIKEYTTESNPSLFFFASTQCSSSRCCPGVFSWWVQELSLVLIVVCIHQIVLVI